MADFFSREITASPWTGLTLLPALPCPCRPIPSVIVLGSLGFPKADWVEQGIAALSARRSRTSPITGIRLQRLLFFSWQLKNSRSLAVTAFGKVLVLIRIGSVGVTHPP